jgi:sugar phosphate isomerase/epimerase
MNMTRRKLLQTAGMALAAAALPPKAVCATSADQAGGIGQMRLGLVTYNLAKDWPIETIIRNCKEARFQGVELRTTHGHKVEVDLTTEQRQEVKRRFLDSEVELMGLGSAFDYHTPDQGRLRKDIEATKAYVVLAHDVGASGVKVRPNALPKEVSVEKTLEQIGRSLRELGVFGADYGVQIRLEVHGSGTSLLPNVRKIIDVADHRNVGVCWNSNQSDLAGEGFDSNFKLVSDRIMLVHMRDLFLEEYPWRKLLRRLAETGYRGYCLAEIPESKDPVRVMKYYRALWMAYQDLI